jgi:hypothetical protein
MSSPPVEMKPGVWLRLPSGRTAEVRKVGTNTDTLCYIVDGKKVDGAFEACTVTASEVTLRYVDQDGILCAGAFSMLLSFIFKHAVPIAR